MKKKVDGNTVWKWVLIGLAGLLGLGASVFDQRSKDKLYEEKLDETISKQAKRLLEENKTA